MKSFFRKLPFSRKNGSRLLLAVMIVIGIYLFKNYIYSSPRFSFQSDKMKIFDVQEKGKIVYTSGRISELANDYKNEEKVNIDGSLLTLHGKIDGKIDPVLTPFFNSRKYFTKVDLSDVGSACSENFNPLYPVAIRRLIYFMPKEDLFDGQAWKIKTCNGRFECSYNLSYKEENPFVELLCSGEIEDCEVAVSGNIVINKKLNGFNSVTLDITSSTKELVSNWIFNDTLNR